MRKGVLCAVAATVLGSAAAVAAPYGDAGCGLGSLVFGDKPGFVQVLAATTNGIFASQTFGITTGTLNCGGMGGGGSDKVVKAFVEVNREALAKDIARGQGETIHTLSVIGGCQDSAAVGASLQKNFQTIFPNETAANADGTAA